MSAAAIVALGPTMLRQLGGRAWRWLRHVPERLLHARRRDRLVRALARDGLPAAVVFVCHGNVCRSPYAEYRLRALLGGIGSRMPVSSLGFVGPDRAPPAPALAEASARGLDMSGHRSRLVAAGALPRSLVLVMNARQARDAAHALPMARRIAVLGDLDPLPIATREIRDPWGLDAHVFADSYDRIDRCVDALFRAWFP